MHRQRAALLLYFAAVPLAMRTPGVRLRVAHSGG